MIICILFLFSWLFVYVCLLYGKLSHKFFPINKNLDKYTQTIPFYIVILCPDGKERGYINLEIVDLIINMIQSIDLQQPFIPQCIDNIIVAMCTH